MSISELILIIHCLSNSFTNICYLLITPLQRKIFNSEFSLCMAKTIWASRTYDRRLTIYDQPELAWKSRGSSLTHQVSGFLGQICLNNACVACLCAGIVLILPYALPGLMALYYFHVRMPSRPDCLANMLD